MSQSEEDQSDKTHEATPQKLRKAREKGEVARSTDLSVSASYAGFMLAALAFGSSSFQSLGSTLMYFLDSPDRMSQGGLGDSAQALMGTLIFRSVTAVAPWFLLPMASVVLVTLAQRAFVVAPGKLEPKMSRVSILSNAKNKFGRTGLFEFAKSFSKLLLYSLLLASFLRTNLPAMIVATATGPAAALALMGALFIKFLVVVLLISTGLGALDAVWQHVEHLRKNRMSHKEMMDETKDAEGDPHVKQQRRQKGQQIAMNQMLSDVPDADVVVVNPTHYAVALKWSRMPGAAPVCVAKGIDEIARAIREKAAEAGVPVHRDPPTARALYASVAIGREIPEDTYREVAAAIRFAEEMRQRARKRAF